MKPWKEVIDGIRNAVLGKEVREDLAQMGEYVEQFANTAGENIQKAIDPTLSLSGKAADAAKVGEAVNAEATRAKAAEKANAKGVSQLKGNKIDKPTAPDDGKIPRAKGGDVEWVEVGQPTDEQTNSAVTKWLDEHPEATTTVQDGAITEQKINVKFFPYIKNYYVAPEMFGAVGDGKTDDSFAIQKALDFGGVCILHEKTYLIQKPLIVDVNKSALRGCSSRSAIEAGTDFDDSTYNACVIFCSKNGDYFTRTTRENEHGCFRINANHHVAMRIGGPADTPIEGACECQTFHNIMCVQASSAMVIGPHAYRNDYRQIDTYDCDFAITTPEWTDCNEVNTFYNCGFWAGSVDIVIPSTFISCTFHLELQQDSKKGYKYAHRFDNGNYNLIGCHFEYLTPADLSGVDCEIDCGLVAVDALVYIEGAHMVFTSLNNTLTVNNYLFYCIGGQSGLPTGFTLNHCATKYLFNTAKLANGALANWGLVSYNGEYKNSWQAPDNAEFTYNKNTEKIFSDSITPLTKIGVSEIIDYDYNDETHTLTAKNTTDGQVVTIGKTVPVNSARGVHYRVKATANENANISINLNTNLGLIFLDSNGNSLNANAISVNNNFQYQTGESLDYSIWLAIPAGCTSVIYGVGIIGAIGTGNTITVEECYVELV